MGHPRRTLGLARALARPARNGPFALSVLADAQAPLRGAPRLMPPDDLAVAFGLTPPELTLATTQ